MDGLETSRRIKANTRLSSIPAILMVTAYGREEVIRKAEETQLDGFLIKPVNQSLLFDTVMNIFGKEEIYRSDAGGLSRMAPDSLSAIRGARVLLVEDNALNREVGVELLRAAGLEVSVAGNGREGVDFALSGAFDCVLMDIQMPEMDGLEAARSIRRHERLKDLPIVAMTAHAMAGDKEKSFEAGMNDHITKPIDPEELHAALLRWIRPGERVGEAPVPGAGEESANDSAEPPEPFELPELPGVDAVEGLRKVGGASRVYLKVLKGFFTDYRESAATLRADLEAGRLEAAKRAAHTIKGVAGTIGAAALFGAAGALEAALREERPEAARKLLQTFEPAMAEVLSGLAELMKPARAQAPEPAPQDASPAPPADPEETREILFRMAGLLDEGDTEAGDLMRGLRSTLRGLGLDDGIEAIAEYIDAFEFEEARAALDGVARSLNLDLKEPA
jgi:two-component system sensor histidine kinase/response regulator